MGLAVNLLKPFIAYACNDFELSYCFLSTRLLLVQPFCKMKNISGGDHSCSKHVALFGLVLSHLLPCLFLDYNRNTSLPLPIHGEQAGSSSSEHGSVSPDSDVQHDVFFERPKRSISEIQTKHPISHLLR